MLEKNSSTTGDLEEKIGIKRKKVWSENHKMINKTEPPILSSTSSQHSLT